MTQEFSESQIYAHYLNVVRIILMSCSLYYTHTYCGPNRTAFYHCTGDYDGILVGDRGSASRQYFMTPFPDPNPGPQIRYNAALARTRARIEITFGQLKGRFQCLKSLRVAPDRACDMSHVLYYTTLPLLERRGPLWWKCSLMKTSSQCTWINLVAELHGTGLWNTIFEKNLIKIKTNK